MSDITSQPQTLVLVVPDPVKAVKPTTALQIAPELDPGAIAELNAKADSFLTTLLSTATRSPQFAAQADAVRRMGDKDIRAASEASNRMLELPLKEMRDSGVSEGSSVSKALLELRRTVEGLDPAEQGGPRKWLRRLPFTNRATDYFRHYESSQTQLDAILNALYSGQDELRKNNASLNLEKQNLWDTMGRLSQYVYVSKRLDERLTEKVADLESSDPETAVALREDVLFYARQKHQDLLTQLAVSIQGCLAIDVIIKNNIELIKGVDRATTTTISALRTAVVVAQALSNQKLVLDQVTALNSTTSSLIESTSRMLVDNSAKIQSQAASSTVGIEQLKKAFENVYATLDSISTFKTHALDAMSQTVGVLETEAAKAKERLDRSRHDSAKFTAIKSSSEALEFPTATKP